MKNVIEYKGEIIETNEWVEWTGLKNILENGHILSIDSKAKQFDCYDGREGWTVNVETLEDAGIAVGTDFKFL